MKNNLYYFHLQAVNHRIILQSEAYTTKQACIGGIISAIENAKARSSFFILRSKDNKPYFILKAKNHKTIGVSETYSSAAACRKGIRSVVKNAQKQGIAFRYFNGLSPQKKDKPNSP